MGTWGLTTKAVVANQIRRPGSKLVSDELLQFLEDELYKGERPTIDLADCQRLNVVCHSRGYISLPMYVKIRHDLRRLIHWFGRDTPVRNVIHLVHKGALE